jgi:hypothetical protein
MISPDQFFGKYDQKGIDFDGYYGFQCMDLYRQFVKECLEFPQSPLVVGAVNVWDTYLADKFDRIENTLTAIPIKGDIVIWSTGVGAYGHIAVCKDGTQSEFTSFDQNWPVGSLCHFQKHNYTNVLGWLRVKPPAPELPIVDCSNCIILKAQLLDCKNEREEAIKQAVNTVSLEKDTLWQSKLDTANVIIGTLKKRQVENLSWKELLSLGFKKLYASRK